MALRTDVASPVDRARRRLIVTLPAALLGACTPDASVSRAPAFTARFRVAGAGTVVLDYAGRDRFAFEAVPGWGATVVVGGAIHLVLAPSLATAGATRVLLAGRLGADLPRAADAVFPDARIDDLADAGWDLDGRVRGIAIAGGADAPDQRLAVGDLAPLARAQRAIASGLASGMDMRLCGDAVARVVRAWPVAVTARGDAVLASSLGVRLQGALAPLARVPALPKGVRVEDLRAPV